MRHSAVSRETLKCTPALELLQRDGVGPSGLQGGHDAAGWTEKVKRRRKRGVDALP